MPWDGGLAHHSGADHPPGPDPPNYSPKRPKTPDKSHTPPKKPKIKWEGFKQDLNTTTQIRGQPHNLATPLNPRDPSQKLPRKMDTFPKGLGAQSPRYEGIASSRNKHQTKIYYETHQRAFYKPAPPAPYSNYTHTQTTSHKPYDPPPNPKPS
ncbi:extensin-like [Penaeus monodon]|uniref:extensin-like n=1 Tax=Penaeus monodon TaxID=6687 RepID=UPI0018A71DAA|nr:extensin-like [Penaeus monodon]